MGRVMATVISSDKATLHEFDTIYGIEDMWLLFDIIVVDSSNRNAINKWFSKHDR
jgi:hypothetical protein